MKTLMTNLETLGFTGRNGLNGLSLNEIEVSLHWSGEEAVVAIDGKQVFSSESEAEIIEFVKKHLPKDAKIEVSEVEYNDDLKGFIVELKDGRIVQVQFERETNRLHADYNTYFAFIDKENDYGLDLLDEEEDLFYEWMSNNKDIQDKIKELDKMGYNMNKEQAIEFVKDQINQYLFIKDQHNKSLKVGYVNGLNTAFLRVGLFTIHDFNELQELLRLAIIAH